jgi:peptide/nickel transport system permease protein
MIKWLKEDGKVFISGFWLVAMCFVFFAAPIVGFKDPTAMNFANTLVDPGKEFILGTDNFGRDLLSRTVYGGRISLAVGLSSTAVALFFGCLLGLVAGYFGGSLGFLIMRVMDFIIAFPPILLAVFVVGLLGGNLTNLILVIGVVYIPRIARVAYGQCIKEKTNEYIQSMRCIGSTNMRIILKGILPNTISPVVVQASIIFAYTLLLESGLSFLGLGIQPPNPTIGGMISAARSFMHLSIFPTLWPALNLSLLVLAANMFSEGLMEKLDPTLH